MKRYLIFILGLLPCFSAFSFPVEDYGEWFRTAQEINQLSQNYTMLQNQYQTMKDQYGAMTGHYGYGGLFNNMQDREWSPNSWDDALKGLSGGNNARYQQLLAAYQANHQTLPTQEYQKSTSPSQAQVYQQQVQTNRAASVNASYAFNTIKSHLEKVQALSQKIESTQNTKAAMDLNSRLVAELAFIQLQELKMQTIVNEQLAQESSNSIAEKTDAAKFNELSK